MHLFGQNCIYTPRMTVWLMISLPKMPEGVNWGNVQICAFFALRSRPSTAPQSDWDHFCFKLKLALWVTRGCAWIHVGHSVCKLAGHQAHNDYQNLNRVVLHGKTACVGLHPQSLGCFTPFFAMICHIKLPSLQSIRLSTKTNIVAPSDQERPPRWKNHPAEEWVLCIAGP